jgi:hypothetical protein
MTPSPNLKHVGRLKVSELCEVADRRYASGTDRRGVWNLEEGGVRGLNNPGGNAL